MKKLILIMLFMTSAFSLMAEKKGMKSELPTLTYYYFDG